MEGKVEGPGKEELVNIRLTWLALHYRDSLPHFPRLDFRMRPGGEWEEGRD